MLANPPQCAPYYSRQTAPHSREFGVTSGSASRLSRRMVFDMRRLATSMPPHVRSPRRVDLHRWPQALRKIQPIPRNPPLPTPASPLACELGSQNETRRCTQQAARLNKKAAVDAKGVAAASLLSGPLRRWRRFEKSAGRACWALPSYLSASWTRPTNRETGANCASGIRSLKSALRANVPG
jgi:hypothetical protein